VSLDFSQGGLTKAGIDLGIKQRHMGHAFPDLELAIVHVTARKHVYLLVVRYRRVSHHRLHLFFTVIVYFRPLYLVFDSVLYMEL
jgi:hypothetical protein